MLCDDNYLTLDEFYKKHHDAERVVHTNTALLTQDKHDIDELRKRLDKTNQVLKALLEGK